MPYLDDMRAILDNLQGLHRAVTGHGKQLERLAVASNANEQANLLTNGGFEVWQRGNGPFTASGAYTADRWRMSIGAAGTMSLTNITLTSGLGGATSSGPQVVYTHGTADSTLWQLLVLTEFPYLRGSTVSLSARVYSSVASAARLSLTTVGTGGATTYSAYHPGNGTWQTLMVSAPIPIDATSLTVDALRMSATGTHYVDNAVLVVGSVAADYALLHPTDDMARCERYRQSIGVDGGGDLIYTMFNAFATAQTAWFTPTYRTQMAITPTATLQGTWTLGGASALAVGGPTTRALYLSYTSTASSVSTAWNSANTANIVLEANP